MSDPATENPNEKMPPGKAFDPNTAIPEGEGHPPADDGAPKVGPEDEKREDLHGEPSAAQAAKNRA